MTTSQGQGPTPVRRVPAASDRLRLLNEEGTEGVLLGTKCRECGVTVFGSTVLCPHCTSDQLEEVELSRRGEVWSFTVVHTPTKDWKGEVPYALVEVELPEGPHIPSILVDCPFDRIRVGMPVELTLRVAGTDSQGNEVVIYRWRPVEEG